MPDAVTVSVSLNGQQFINDRTLHFRDVENTFTYYQDILIHDFQPKNGPVSGKTLLQVTGLGFGQFRDIKGDSSIPPIWVRFRDATTGVQIGETTNAFSVNEDGFYWSTPPADLNTKALLEFSFNKKDW